MASDLKTAQPEAPAEPSGEYLPQTWVTAVAKECGVTAARLAFLFDFAERIQRATRLATVSAPTFRVGGRYNWKGQPERLVYLGRNWSGNGFWHQFEKVDKPGVVWCEVLDSELPMIEETKEPGHG